MCEIARRALAVRDAVFAAIAKRAMIGRRIEMGPKAPTESVASALSAIIA